jgi:GH24 family phage-related lysozyme (muramidase)
MSLVSQKCVDFVKSFEGFSSVPYLDAVGVKTLGYGMTGAAIANLTSITEAQASQMLENLLNNNYATPIKSNLDSKGVKLSQNQFDALVSMAYNIGVSGLLGSTLYKNVVAGIRDKATITSNFQAWSNADGKRLDGLFRRRTSEAEMFFRNDNVLEIIKEEKKVKNLVVYGNSIDRRAAEYKADFLKCPTLDGNIPFDYSVVENVVCVGGAPSIGWTSYAKEIITGTDRFDTIIKVLKSIGKL